jgi:hypothetical protein
MAAKRVGVPDRMMFDVTIEQYSFRNRDMDVSERERSGYDVTFHRAYSSSAFTQSAMTRAEIAFTVARLQAFLDDTDHDDNIVYMMACGHEHDSPYRLTRRSRGYCSQHGFQPLTEGMFLPTWRSWVKGLLKTSHAARDEMHSANY